MRIETTTRNLYTFDELTDEAKENARNWWREGALNDEWYDFIYEDAERIGVKITEFDLGRADYCKLHVMDTEHTARLIIDQHGEECETYKTATDYLATREALIEGAERDEDGEIDEYALDEALDEVDAEFVKSLAEDYRIMLDKGCEWYFSDENVDESIRCNEYEFTEDGRIA